MKKIKLIGSDQHVVELQKEIDANFFTTDHMKKVLQLMVSQSIWLLAICDESDELYSESFDHDGEVEEAYVKAVSSYPSLFTENRSLFFVNTPSFVEEVLMETSLFMKKSGKFETKSEIVVNSSDSHLLYNVVCLLLEDE